MTQYFCDPSRPGLSAMYLTEWERQAREGNSPFAGADGITRRNPRQASSRRIRFGQIWRLIGSSRAGASGRRTASMPADKVDHVSGAAG